MGRNLEANFTQEIDFSTCTRNSSNCTERIGDTLSFPSVLTIFGACVISLIILAIAFGNLMVILAVKRDRHLKHCIQNRFILSLAVADLLLGVLIMPLSLYLEILKYWGLGTLLCDIWLAMDVFLCTASTLSLVVVSLDRYMSVTRALEYPQLRTVWKVNVAIAGIWATSALVSLPPIAGWKANRPEVDKSSPQCHLSDELGYIAYSLTISFYIPMAIILIAYWRICLVARRRSKQHIRLGALQNTPNDSNNAKIYQTANTRNADTTFPDTRLLEVDAEESSDSNGKTSSSGVAISKPNGQPKGSSKTKLRFEFSLKRLPSKQKEVSPQAKKYKLARGRERRATLTIAIIVAGFMICWVPFSLIYLIDRLCLCGIRDHSIFAVIFWMGYCNSAMNPILYSIFNREFREAFRRLLCRK